MYRDKDSWRDIVNIAWAGLRDLIESLIVCFTIFGMLASIGLVKNFDLYFRIIREVAWIVLSTSLGIRLCKEVKKISFTVTVCLLIAINIAVSSIILVMSILS
ncbi:MAG: hypothetical protein IKE91_05795 [Clostridia bacterium]|nr:hypothetical protein [Clostridia bacterium]